MNWKILIVIVLAICCWSAALEAKGGNGVVRTPVSMEEDWPENALLWPGTINCPGGELDLSNPQMPECTGERTHLRGAVGYGCYTATDSRLSGVGMWVVNGNLDEYFTGPVWGTYVLYPGDPCYGPVGLAEPDVFFDDPPDVYWKGTWRGYRSMGCDGNCWIGALKLVAKGYGGDIAGLHFKGSETITTYSPLPVPWELIFATPPYGPEGEATGTIKEK